MAVHHALQFRHWVPIFSLSHLNGVVVDPECSKKKKEIFLTRKQIHHMPTNNGRNHFILVVSFFFHLAFCVWMMCVGDICYRDSKPMRWKIKYCLPWSYKRLNDDKSAVNPSWMPKKKNSIKTFGSQKVWMHWSRGIKNILVLFFCCCCWVEIENNSNRWTNITRYCGTNMFHKYNEMQ